MLDLAAKTVSSGPLRRFHVCPAPQIRNLAEVPERLVCLYQRKRSCRLLFHRKRPAQGMPIYRGRTGCNLFIRKTGDAFGLAEIVLGQNHSCYTQCLHDSQIWVLDAAIIQEKIHSDHEVMSDILYTMTDRLIHHQSTVELLISKPVPWRLAWLLQQLGTPVGDGDSRIDLVLNHEEISNMIGCSRQTVSELLSKWKAQ